MTKGSFSGYNIHVNNQKYENSEHKNTNNKEYNLELNITPQKKLKLQS